MWSEQQDRPIQAPAVGLLNSNAFQCFYFSIRKVLCHKASPHHGLYSCICPPTEVAQSKRRPIQCHKIKNSAKFDDVQRVWFAFILKVGIPCFCLNRADGTSHFETERKHRLREEVSLIIVNLCFCNIKRSQWLLALAPLKKTHLLNQPLNTDQNSKVNYF